MTMSESMHRIAPKITDLKKIKQVVVIKIGGSILSELKDGFYQDILHMLNKGWFPIIVHGGGPSITKLLTEIGIHSEFVNGLRVTTKEVLEVAQMVLIGKENKEIVKNLHVVGGNAIGLSGIDNQMILVEQLDKKLGYVGRIKEINFPMLSYLISQDIIPVISPLGMDKNGQVYNINADTVAQAIAVELKASKILLVSDIPGIYYSNGDKKSILHILTPEDIYDLMEKKQFTGGMIPKVEAAVECLNQGIDDIYIFDGRDEGALLKVYEHQLVGTRIRKAGVI